MKYKVPWWLGIAVAALLASARLGGAQQCYSFSSDLAEYTSVSSDGTSIYTTVAVDGSQEMNAWGQCQQLLGYAVHTPYTFNQLSTPEQTVGGYLNPGNGVCASCYISAASEQYITPLPSEQVEFENEAMAGCNFGGNFFDSGSNYIGIAIAVTNYQFVTVNQDNTVTFKKACPARTVASCGAANLIGSQPTLWAVEKQLKVTIGGSSPVCELPGIVQYFNGAPAPYPCS